MSAGQKFDRGKQDCINVVKILKDILEELKRADDKHSDDPMSPEELKASWGTIRCELYELKREVDRVNKRPADMRKEAVQLGAMAVKFLRDCC